VKWGI